MSAPDIIGHGWSFPATWDAEGRVELVTGTTDINQAIYLILATVPGERPMRPEFGCHIHDLVFAPLNASTTGLIEEYVREALDRWEPRAEILEVGVSGDAQDEGLVYIDIQYRPRGLNDFRNLVFPFYTIPSHPSDSS
ncbi:GPW/gp25 family protein [Streptomyces vinaceus]|uniref:GPW/gp25 family protein n=1 Tax=Streptomyces vinaceus TaxID=1960 RepID=UPI0036AF4D6E